MNRLTRRVENGTYIVPNEDRYKYGLRNEMIQTLGQYEDIGLTPDQIREVDLMYTEKCKEVANLLHYISDIEQSYSEKLKEVEKLRAELEEAKKFM